MCGIVGYVGPQEVIPILIDGLEKLEYRGYDSTGIAIPRENGVVVLKKEGRLAALKDKMHEETHSANVGIGHTRWATHGKPSDENAHPHTDCSKKFAVVHNGIIENYLPLREWLQRQGHVLCSQTDTEVLPHLIEHFYDGDLLEAVQQTAAKLEGSYAMAVVSSYEPGKLVAVRQDSPLIIGLGEGEFFLASDIPAFLNYTRRTYVLNDGEVAVLERDRISILDRNGRPVDKDVFEVHWEAAQAEKGGYNHFMLKEIYEQPKAIRDTMRGRLAADNSKVVLDEVNLAPAEIRALRKIFISACGTAYNAGVVGKYVIEKLARIPVEVDIASEFRYRQPIIEPDTLVIIISQSGETADTLAALREARKQGARVVAITNVVGSSVAREADDVIYTWAGPEIAVASTKAYTTQLLSIFLLAVHLAGVRGEMDPAEAQEIINEMRMLDTKAQDILNNSLDMQEYAGEMARNHCIFFLGRGLDYAVAMEGSLKLKEISYIHAEAYAAGELKHGTLALIEEGVPVVALATQDELFDKMISNIQEVNARGADVLALATEGLNKDVEKVAARTAHIPKTHSILAPILAVIPLQLLAYYTAVARGCDVDKPRNLAKSVTVE